MYIHNALYPYVLEIYSQIKKKHNTRLPNNKTKPTIYPEIRNTTVIKRTI